MDLNIKKWKRYRIGDFFETKRGSRIVKREDYYSFPNNENVFEVITCKSNENGIDGYYKKWNSSGKFLVMAADDGSGFLTYHEGKKWVVDSARILFPKNFELNEYLAIFLITIIFKRSCKFSYGHKPNPKDIDELIIMLPSKKNEDGSYSPDWEFMERYIKYLRERERGLWIFWKINWRKNTSLWY